MFFSSLVLFQFSHRRELGNRCWARVLNNSSLFSLCLSTKYKITFLWGCNRGLENWRTVSISHCPVWEIQFSQGENYEEN
ncbi:hypothetical protein C8R34_1174 [Nitrosomonas sp. Nm84]|nr:hypothetical protein C8R34_1174 [Nitrosomonas sp. Nm84]